MTQPPHQDGKYIRCWNVHPSPIQDAFPPKPPKIPLPLQVPAPPPHALAGSPAVPGWCQHLARAIRAYTSYPGLLGGHPSPERGQEAGESSPERPGGAGRLLGPGGQAAHLCLQWPVAVAAEDGHAAGAGMPGAGREPLAGNRWLLRLRLWLNLLTLLLLASFCSLLGCRGQATHGRELPLVTQLQTARGYF